MTTIIAVQGDGLYADSKCVAGDGVPNHATTKLYRVGKFIIGGAGHLKSIIAFVKWFSGDRKKPHKLKNLTALVMSKKHGLWWFGDETSIGFQVLDDRYAIGSGAVAALAALEMGAKPERAIQVASKFDDMTGGAVQYMSLRGD